MTPPSPVRWLALVLAMALTIRSAEAQVCIGAAPFSNGNVRVGVGGGGKFAGFGGADGEPSVGAQVALGGSRRAFAAVGASATLYSGSKIRFIREKFATQTADDATSGTLSFSGGYSVSASPSRHVELCPIAGFAVQNGPSLYRQCTPYVPGRGISCSDGVEGSARALWFGGSIGRIHQVSPGFAFVPFAGAAFVSSRIAAGGRSQTDGYVEVSLGAGLVAKRVTIRPTLSFPTGLEGGSRSFGLQLALNIGPKR